MVCSLLIFPLESNGVLMMPPGLSLTGREPSGAEILFSYWAHLAGTRFPNPFGMHGQLLISNLGSAPTLAFLLIVLIPAPSNNLQLPFPLRLKLPHSTRFSFYTHLSLTLLSSVPLLIFPTTFLPKLLLFRHLLLLI